MSNQNREPDTQHTLRVQQLFVQHPRRLRAFVLGCEAQVAWNRAAAGLVVTLPARKLAEGPFVLRIEQR